MKKLIVLILAVCSFQFMYAQSTYTLVSGKNMVKGTSTLHDWRCVVEKQSGTAVINTNGTFSIQSLNAKLSVKSMKSIKETGAYYDSGMDKNAYKALNADKYPEIVFVLTGVSGLKTAGNVSTFNAVGNLSIAGKTNKVSIPTKAVVSGNNVTFTGSTSFKMTSFGVTPPKALMGTIKTGDDVTIVINSTYQK